MFTFLLLLLLLLVQILRQGLVTRLYLKAQTLMRVLLGVVVRVRSKRCDEQRREERVGVDASMTIFM